MDVKKRIKVAATCLFSGFFKGWPSFDGPAIRNSQAKND
jgi:hypothetical protein